jgi:hypothetical protein
MQDNPSAEKLLAAMRAFLIGKAMPQLSGQAAFHARVAGNVLDILARELELAPGFNRAEQARLESLLGESGSLEDLNRKLCDKIATGEMDLTHEKLKTHLIMTTMGKLAIDQPRYQGYKTAKANGWPEETFGEKIK